MELFSRQPPPCCLKCSTAEVPAAVHFSRSNKRFVTFRGMVETFSCVCSFIKPVNNRIIFEQARGNEAEGEAAGGLFMYTMDVFTQALYVSSAYIIHSWTQHMRQMHQLFSACIPTHYCRCSIIYIACCDVRHHHKNSSRPLPVNVVVQGISTGSEQLKAVIMFPGESLLLREKEMWGIYEMKWKPKQFFFLLSLSSARPAVLKRVERTATPLRESSPVCR